MQNKKGTYWRVQIEEVNRHQKPHTRSHVPSSISWSQMAMIITWLRKCDTIRCLYRAHCHTHSKWRPVLSNIFASRRVFWFGASVRHSLWASHTSLFCWKRSMWSYKSTSFPNNPQFNIVKLKYSTHNQVCNFLLSTCNNWPFLTLKLKLHGVILVSHPELRDPFESSMSRIDGTSVDPKFLSIDSQIHFLESSYERLPLWIHYQIWKMPLAYQSSAGLVHLNRMCFMIHPG